MKPRYVYFIKPVGMDGPVKIGCSDTPVGRLKSLAAWSPFPLELLATVPGDFDLERNVHDCFADTHLHREWFNASPTLSAAIAALQKGLPITEAIDLSKRTGSIRKLRAAQGGAGWSPATKLYMSLFHRIRFAAKRASAATGKDLRFLPGDLDLLFESIRDGRIPTDAEMARINEAIADPAAHFVTWQQRNVWREAA